MYFISKNLIEMYKKFSLEQICNLDCKFIPNLKKLYQTRKFNYLKEFLKSVFQNGQSVYFVENGAVYFKISIEEKNYIFTDEQEKIELMAGEEEINKLHNFLKDTKKIKNLKQNKSLLESLWDDFLQGDLLQINNKPYLVYDIETVGNIGNFQSLKFMVGYSCNSAEDHMEDIKYKYINPENLSKFVNFLVEFEGYIIGYNNISFDNPVIINNVAGSATQLDILNQKSIDLFLFISHLLGRRLSLNFVASNLVGLAKTLNSGQEGANLLEKYIETGDTKILTKVKNYCKNDVQMTLGLFLYLYKYQKINFEGQDFIFNSQDLVDKSQILKNTDKNSSITPQKGLFD